MIVQLSRPFKDLEGRMVSHVTLREQVNGGDILAQERVSLELEKTFVLIAKLCGLDRSEVESMSIKDINTLSEKVAAVLQAEGAADPKESAEPSATSDGS